ncbi:response regulator [Pedobacter sp. SYSU D00535]|uniref:response regulator n=1 Tax=Pedobacter sp. SYSU D00535 TaxID=2810308 RepID=UPI001A958532|nr:response regulator [Pedobacter sp. SYSU D00535]
MYTSSILVIEKGNIFLSWFGFTWWIELLIVVVLIIGAYFFHRSKIKNLQHDISDLKRQLLERTEMLTYSRQNEQNARDEADLANKNKSALISKISHDIRTPMNTVMGMASLLKETPLTAEQMEYSSTILESGESLLKLTNDILMNDILEYSKVESGKELEVKEFNLRIAVEEVLDIFAARAAQADLDLVYSIDSDVPSLIVGDTMRLHQILMNLIENSIKFTHQGEIFVGVHLAEADDENQIKLQFEVRDTGSGMNLIKESQIAKQLADSHYHDESQGYGLIICKNLVHLMGGSISVESQEGRGSMFRFTIVTRTSPQVVRSVQADMAGLDDKKILIVDDNASVRHLLSRQLAKWSLNTSTTESGKKALEHLASDKAFDLLLIDLVMPEMDGIQLAKLVNEQHPNLPIILLNKTGDTQHKKHPGLFSSILNKPIRQHRLKEQVIAALRNKNKTTLSADQSKLSVDFAKQYPLNILVAEDDVMNQKVVIRVLGKLGYEPMIVNNGKEVLEEVSQKTYDVILMDVQMPEMDGLEASRMIRLCLNVQPVIIAMTANTLQGDRDECLRSGMDDYISKPVKLEELVNLLEKWAMHSKLKH